MDGLIYHNHTRRGSKTIDISLQC